MKKEQYRVCMYPKDIQLITGKSYNSSLNLLLKIKKHLAREKHQFVSLEEFCNYTGLHVEEVAPMISG